MSDELLRIYRGKIASLNGMDELTFATALRDYRAGNEFAGRAISEAMLQVALHVAEEHIWRLQQRDPLDVVQEANAALQDAIKCFSGVRLSEFLDFARRHIAAKLALL